MFSVFFIGADVSSENNLMLNFDVDHDQVGKRRRGGVRVRDRVKEVVSESIGKGLLSTARNGRVSTRFSLVTKTPSFFLLFASFSLPLARFSFTHASIFSFHPPPFSFHLFSSPPWPEGGSFLLPVLLATTTTTTTTTTK
jgi:hypothetical protein